MKRRAQIAAGSAVVCLGFVLMGWFVAKHFLGLYALGEMDSAIVTMRILVNDENSFARDHPNLGHSCKLADLSSNPAIASGRRNGYVFEILDCATTSTGGPNETYHVIARPLHSGLPAYCSDQSGILKADYDGSVTNCLRKGQPL